MWLVAAAARAFGRSTTTIAALTMALSFGIVYYGAATVYVTDLLPVALSICRDPGRAPRQVVLAGIAIGLGAALKLFPLLLAAAARPAATARRATRVRRRRGSSCSLTFAPLALLNWPIFLSPFNWQSSRPPWETWFAFVNWLSGAPHDFPQPYFQDASVGGAYGWVFTGITPPVNVLQAPVPAGPPRWENAVEPGPDVLALGLVIVLAARRSRANRRAQHRALVRCLRCAASSSSRLAGVRSTSCSWCR